MAHVRSQGRELPGAGSVILLGTVYRVSSKERGSITRHHWGRLVFDSDGQSALRGAEIVEHSTQPPQLWWSKESKTLYFFPGFPHAKGWKNGVPPHAVEAAKLYHQWDHHANWPDIQSVDLDFPEPRIYLAGTAFDIVYRSQKWNGKKGKHEFYNHHFSKSGAVKLYEAKGKKPSAFVVNGGRLTVNDRGIVY